MPASTVPVPTPCGRYRVKLASRIISSNRKAEEVAPTFGEMLDDAYAWLKDKMPLPDDRKQAIEEGIESIRAAAWRAAGRRHQAFLP